MVQKRGKQRTTNKKKEEEPIESVEYDEGKETAATSDNNFIDSGQNDNDNEQITSQITETKHEKDDDTLSQEDENESDGEKEHEEIINVYKQKFNFLLSEHSMFFLVVAISLIFIMASQWPSFGPWPSLNSNDKIEIELSLKQLANDFPNQSQYSYKKLKSRVLSYIRHKTSPQPFVLMVASAEDDQPTGECFAKRVAQLFTTALVTINGSKYLNNTSDNAKLDIDGRLRNVFQKRKFPTAAIVHNLDSIPYGTTTLFYAYCDHDNPIFKEAAIIFTITLPQDYHIAAVEHDREGLVEKYLSKDSPWVKDEKFSSDIMGALISRITDTVIVVNKESEESLKKSC
jgi:hypothetical protein